MQQHSVGRVHLHALEARVDGPACGGGEVGDRGPDVVRRHRPRDGGLPMALRCEDRLRQRDRGGCEGREAGGRRVADPAPVLELQEHPPAGRPHRIGDPPPAGGDDQPGRGPLSVVGDHQVRRGTVGLRTVPGQRGHHEVVGEGEPAEPGGGEEVRCPRHAGTVKLDTDVRFKPSSVGGGHADR